MLLLVGDDLRDRCCRAGVGSFKFGDLLIKVTKDNAFDRHRGSRNGLAAYQPGQEPKRQPAEPAKMKTPASAQTSPCHFCGEQVAMATFMGQEFIEFCDHGW